MRALFLVSDTDWSARARAFVLAARGLAERGHDVRVACADECPVQVRAAECDIPVLPMAADASTAGSAWNLRSALRENGTDVIFVHTDAEQLAASSALRLAGGGAVVRRIPPFEGVAGGGRSRIASRIAPTGLLFTTEADMRAAEGKSPLPSALAPLGVDVERLDGTRAAARDELGVPAETTLIVCVHDGGDQRPVLTALRTLSLLLPRHPNLHLAIVGANRQDELRMHGAALGVNAMVTYLGGRKDELSVLCAADIGWIAASGDAAALAALDFMALRKPLVAQRTPLLEHYVADGIAGVLLSPADAPTTAGAVAAFVANEAQRAAMANAGRARVQREFSSAAMISGFEAAAAVAANRSAQPAA